MLYMTRTSYNCIQTIFQISPYFGDHFLRHTFHSSYNSFLSCAMFYSGVLNTWSFTYTHKKKSAGVRLGDLAGQFVGPYFPIQFWLKMPANRLRAARLLRDGAPSCWNKVFSGNFLLQIGHKSLVAHNNLLFSQSYCRSSKILTRLLYE